MKPYAMDVPSPALPQIHGSHTSDEDKVLFTSSTNDPANLSPERVSHLARTIADARDGEAVANDTEKPSAPSFVPIAICGMACRLPGGIHSPAELWTFLLSKGDARTRVPETRFNVPAYHSHTKKPRTTVSEYGYFLDESVDLGALDTSFYPMAREELEALDPQQRLLLEVAREALDDAGEVNWRGTKVGVYVGSFGNDRYDVALSDHQKYGHYQITTTHDFALSNRISYEMDLRGPSMTIRTACSSSLIGLNEACTALAKGDCTSAIVGGTNIIMAPALTTAVSEQGALSPDGSCKTFSSAANGYARGEAIVAIYVKPLSDAIRDGNPVRAVITGTATNCDGRTPGFTVPSSSAQEALIRHTYKVTGISMEDASKTGFFECHGTGTTVGDSLEAAAVAKVFGKTGGIHIGSVKPNLGHGEGASGLTAVLKAVLALEHQTIPPNIKSSPPNQNIPFADAQLKVPTEATPWPEDRYERVSINSFGIGGANAHVILDSTRSFGITSTSSGTSNKPKPNNTPQLLVYSANHSRSLERMADSYLQYLEHMTEDMPSVADLAYTLANRREHLPNRSFTVTTRYKPNVVSPPASPPRRRHAIVMVFTGQGAQWPQMGRDLLRAYPVFCDVIRSLDSYLRDLGPAASGATDAGAGVGAPDWSIEDELLKPSRASRVNQAEFSQPLCTAVQIAYVDILASIGIRPAAVVGHSSGEIAAAYAAGALTSKEAIVIAYYRGVISKKQQRPGAMAAVGLSWQAIRAFLVPGVVVACDNSPNSVTISGDAERIQTLVATIQEALPNVPVSVLKVEKAYHSHHMEEFGDEYQRALVTSGVSGAAPVLPFSSSVTGTLLWNNGDHSNTQLNPSYWRKNLVSPVLFNAAVSNLINESPGSAWDNPIFLEVGPHSALAGPLRQIMTHETKSFPYLSLSARRENSVETFLTVVGKLWAIHVDLDFRSLIKGSCLPGLPSYPWHHSQQYWKESRVSKEWRFRTYPHHDLLGAKVPESSSMEPVWRNLFLQNDVPWISDHKIQNNVVFPFAGYVCMATEAARQVSSSAGGEGAVELQHVKVITALVLNNKESPIELVTTLRRHRLTDYLDSDWWEFAVTSYNGHAWTRHCSGEVRAVLASNSLQDGAAFSRISLPHWVDRRQWYERAYRGGLQYGERFATMENIRSTATGLEGAAEAEVENYRPGDEAHYHLHPAVLDTCFQIMSVGAHHGFTHAYKQLIPLSIDFLALSGCSADSLTIISSCKPSGDGIVGEVSAMNGSKAYLQATGVQLTRLDTDDVNEEDFPSITARCEWVPHIDFSSFEALMKLADNHAAYIPSLELFSQLAISLTKRSLSTADVPIQNPDLVRYKQWLDQQAFSTLEDLDNSTLTHRMTSLFASLVESPACYAAMAINKVFMNTPAIISGRKQALEVLHSDDTLTKLQELLMGSLDASAFYRCLAHSKPNLRILEIGTGFRQVTNGVLDHLKHSNGQILYSEYVYTNSSPAVVALAKERSTGVPNLEFATLDISQELENQDFQPRDFDLVIAFGVVNSTPNLLPALRNVRKLLSSDGRLVIQQPQPGQAWMKYVMGLLPQWWCGVDDGRSDGPYAGPGRYNDELLEAGFHGISSSVSDSLSTYMLARPRQQTTRKKEVVLLRGSLASIELAELENELEVRGFKVSQCTLNQALSATQDVIALLDITNPFFDNIDAVSFEAFKRFCGELPQNKSGVLWVTRPSQMTSCNDPRNALAIGLARTIRVEMGVDFATCETDDLGTARGLRALTDVFCRFHERGDASYENSSTSSDLEYVIAGGVVYVNRFFRFSQRSELTRVADPTFDSSVPALRIERPGQIGTIVWAPRPLAVTMKGADVQVEVHAVGLNFRDLMEALGSLKIGRGCGIGVEAAGVVRRIGPDVTKFRPGDRVILTGTETLAATTTSTELLCEKLPEDLSFIEGASLAVAFQTAIHALINIGKLEQGQSVLIHSGCGGVGLASIQIARMLGAKIYTTVGTEEKVDYLVRTFDIPRNCVFNSRTPRFTEDVLRETGGRGVDVALNSLSGECLHATWRCIAKWGTMVEIGKVDLLGAGKLSLDAFLGSRNYCCFDLRQMGEERPQMYNRLLQSTTSYYRRGLIRPIPLAKLFSASDVQSAFQYMQRGNHIGKIVISLRDNDGQLSLNPVAANLTGPTFDPSASYLLVGGFGGLGRSVSAWMVERGARNLTVLSRSAGSKPGDREFLHALESMGCRVQLVAGNVADIDDVSQAVAGTPGSLKGIIHMAMVLRDEALSRMSIDDWREATEPKVAGTWNLHEASRARGCPLDFFILFSSLSGILGQPGQANYAAANAFLDAFARYRNSCWGLPCTALAIGAMEGVGYLSENEALLKKMRGTGWNPVKEEELLQALGAAIMLSHTGRNAPSKPLPSPGDHNNHGTNNTWTSKMRPNCMLVGVTPSASLSHPESSARLRQDVRMAVYYNNIGSKRTGHGVGDDANALKVFLAGARNDPRVLKEPGAAVFLAREVGRKLFAVLLNPDDKEPDITRGLDELGLDSLIAVEVRSWWKHMFGVDISVLEMLAIGTLQGLGIKLAKQLADIYGS